MFHRRTTSRVSLPAQEQQLPEGISQLGCSGPKGASGVHASHKHFDYYGTIISEVREWIGARKDLEIYSVIRGIAFERGLTSTQRQAKE